MKYTVRKRCPKCCPENTDWTNIHDRATSEDGAPVWRCRNCKNELPRRDRRSKRAMIDAEAREALGLDADDLSLDTMLAMVDYRLRKEAGVPLTGELTTAEMIRMTYNV